MGKEEVGWNLLWISKRDLGEREEVEEKEESALILI